MKLQNCCIDNNMLSVMKPPIKNEPDPNWIQSCEKKFVPLELYNFYYNADFFSVDKIPHFFKADNGKILFYLEAQIEGIRKAFESSYELIEMMKKHRKNSYTPIKDIKNIEYESGSLEFQCFKYMLINLAGSLDQFAEVIALFFPMRIPKLNVGFALFSRLKEWILESSTQAEVFDSTSNSLLDRIKTELKDIVEGKETEEEWIEFFMFLRNKLAHLNLSIFPRYSFHNKEMEFYTFIAKRWPVTRIEECIRFESEIIISEPNSLLNLFLDTLIHQDIIEYSELLIEKVKYLLDSGFRILVELYESIKDSEPDDKALKELNGSTRVFKFKSFKPVES